MYGDVIRLTGFDIQPPQLEPGGSASVKLYWQPIRQVPGDFTTYVHLVNTDGTKAGQSDHLPGGAFYPTSLWQPGEVLGDVHALQLAADLGRPPYRIVVGLYQRTANGQDLVPLGEPQKIGSIEGH
jgi:hypothetical protein